MTPTLEDIQEALDIIHEYAHAKRLDDDWFYSMYDNLTFHLGIPDDEECEEEVIFES